VKLEMGIWNEFFEKKEGGGGIIECWTLINSFAINAICRKSKTGS
jgi:hypothetical protein